MSRRGLPEFGLLELRPRNSVDERNPVLFMGTEYSDPFSFDGPELVAVTPETVPAGGAFETERSGTQAR